MKRLSLCLAAVLACTTAQADTPGQCNALGMAGAYNAFVFEDYAGTYSDVQGRLAVGGNLTIDHYSIGDQLPPATAGISLVVGGNVVFPNGAIVQGSALIGGSGAGIGTPVRNSLQPGQTITDHTALPLDFPAEYLRLKALSQSIAALPANGTRNFQWGVMNLLGDCSSPLQVFDLDGQEVLDAHTFALECVPQGATVVFNIAGDVAGLTNMGFDTIHAHRERVLYNFHEARQLVFAGVGVQGSVLAPDAAVEQPQGVIEGALVARSWNGPMQINAVAFHGCGLPDSSSNQPPQAHPQLLVTPMDTPLRVLLAGSDAEHATLTFALDSSPAHGTLQGDPLKGELKYHPVAGFTGTDGFTFRSHDGVQYSAPAAIAIEVLPQACESLR